MGREAWLRGLRGEEAAVSYLRSRGYEIIARNFRYRGGEIDIIALDGKTLVFIEVKTRQARDPGLPLLNITWRKRMKVMRAARFYLKTLAELEGGLVGHPDCRFDVVSVLLDKHGAVLDHELIRGAFWGEGA